MLRIAYEYCVISIDFWRELMVFIYIYITLHILPHNFINKYIFKMQYYCMILISVDDNGS